MTPSCTRSQLAYLKKMGEGATTKEQKSGPTVVATENFVL